MSRDPNGPRQSKADLRTPQTADDALIAWDELDEQLLKMLAEDPERGRRLRKLQDADAWLRARAAEAARKAGGPALLECPPAEELYEFGQGPGASGLSEARREAIDRHLATCGECEAYVETLTVPPPPPLILGLPEEDLERSGTEPAWKRPSPHAKPGSPIPQAAPILPMRRKGPRRVLVGAGLAAAAALVAFIGLRSMTPEPLRFPEAPLLRGSAGGPILYPRGHVLVPSDELKAVFPALGGPITWQIEPHAEASEYRLEFIRHTGGAFARELETKSLTTTGTSGAAPIPFAAGNYTTKAWAIVNGLDQRLGERDFSLREDPLLDTQLLALKSKSEPERTMSALALLHSRGYVNDARALARALPASSERDQYLDQVPGR